MNIFKHIDNGEALIVLKPFTVVQPGQRVYLLDTNGELVGVAVEPSAELLRQLMEWGYTSGIVYLK